MSGTSWTVRLVAALEARSALVIAGAVAVTVLLAIPMVALEPEEQASQDPSGRVFDLRASIDERFETPVHWTSFIAEAKSGDLLTSAPLRELYENGQRLLEADTNGELAPEDLEPQQYLYRTFDPDSNRITTGLISIAEAVQRALVEDPQLNTTLAEATDDQVKLALHGLFANPQSVGWKDSLSIASSSERRAVDGVQIDYWTSPAAFVTVLADNELLGGGSLEIGVGGDETVLHKEEFSRNVQEVLRGDQASYDMWGIAIDANLESADEGQTAGMFIMFTVIAAVLIVWVSLRSYWAMALTGLGLGMLMIWLRGASALIGLKAGLVIDLIVPIAMISLGVDFAVHAVRRYQEEQGHEADPRRALNVGLAGVMGALVLAMLSDGIAFLSNASSGIEAVIQFGIAAALAVLGSFFVLGIIVPLALMRIDAFIGPTAPSGHPVVRALKLANGFGVAALFGTSVIFIVAVSKPLGFGVLALSAFVALMIPLGYQRWRGARGAGAGDTRSLRQRQNSDPLHVTSVTEGLVSALAARAKLVLLVTVGVTALAGWYALKLEPSFDVKDFFDNESDFVVSLDKVDEHAGNRGGEPGVIYVEGDLTDPAVLAAIDAFVDKLNGVEELARSADDDVIVGDHIGVLVRTAMEAEFAKSAIEGTSGVTLTDDDGNGLPDDSIQVSAVLDFIVAHGIPLGPETLRFTPGEVAQVLSHAPGATGGQAAVIEVPIVGTREQENVAAARDSLQPLVEELATHPGITLTGLTGSPFARDAQLTATTRTLQTSMPIAAAGAFFILLVALRSVRYAFVTIIPIGLVVAWLYGLMYSTGFALNFVTAMIGAVSIGVGIDYSIHMTARFREELTRAPTAHDALRQAARGTGVALVASAASSVVGFAIMGFAPMPMFASYGQLTAMMIMLALAASLVVLPSLLLLVTPSGSRAAEPEASPEE